METSMGPRLEKERPFFKPLQGMSSANQVLRPLISVTVEDLWKVLALLNPITTKTVTFVRSTQWRLS
jgi:hypothetical protein